MQDHHPLQQNLVQEKNYRWSRQRIENGDGRHKLSFKKETANRMKKKYLTFIGNQFLKMIMPPVEMQLYRETV